MKNSETERQTDRRPNNVAHLLKRGDYFAWDSEGADDGDIIYAEVLEVQPRFAPDTDYVGDSAGGYKVRAYSAAGEEQGPPGGIEDFYARDFVNRVCVRLSRAQMSQAKQAGWPPERAFVRDALGVHLPAEPEDSAE